MFRRVFAIQISQTKYSVPHTSIEPCVKSTMKQESSSNLCTTASANHSTVAAAVARCCYTTGLSWVECIHLSFSNCTSNYYFCWGKLSVLCKHNKSELPLWKAIGKGILSLAFLFIFFFRGLKIYFRGLTLHLVKCNITDYYRIEKPTRKSQPSLIFLVATSDLLKVERPLKC